MRHLLLSHRLNISTPSYGDRERFTLERLTDIAAGDLATSSRIHTSVHLGTHVDLPAHFFDKGQTADSFPAKFWFFGRPLIIEIEPRGFVVRDELLERLVGIDHSDADLLLVKTGSGTRRNDEGYWRENIGIHPDVCLAIREYLPDVRVFGFDSISVSSFTDRVTGREAHCAFLDPNAPILLLEDMDLSSVNETTVFQQVVVAPLFIEYSEALPCTVYGVIHD